MTVTIVFIIMLYYFLTWYYAGEVRDDESIFRNNVGRRKRQVIEDKAQNFPEGFNFTKEQLDACDGFNIGCLYHLVVIEDQEVADNVLVGGNIINATLDILGKLSIEISNEGQISW